MSASQPQPQSQQPTCPNCGSPNVVPIVYGLVIGPVSKENNYVLGGCVISANSPAWHCRDCRAQFGSLDERAPARARKPQDQR